MSLSKKAKGAVFLVACSATSAAVQFPGEAGGAQALSTDGLILIHPCTQEALSFSGSMQVEVRATAEAGGSSLLLRLDPSGVTATGQMSANMYKSTDILEVPLSVAPLPGSAAAAATARFRGKSESFRAHMTLQVSVSSSGAASVALGNVSLACP